MDKKAKIMVAILSGIVLCGIILVLFTGDEGKGRKRKPIGVESTASLTKSGEDGGLIGYFDETLPEGMQKSYRRGEYIWEKDNSIMVFVPAGPFTMGSMEIDAAQPVRQVELVGYYIDKYEVTIAQYRYFCEQTKRQMPRQPEGKTGDHPVVNVTWQNAHDYARWVGKRLPSEAEWEKAARGGHVIPQWGGSMVPIPKHTNLLPNRKYPWGNADPNAGDAYRCNYRADDNMNARGKDGYETTAVVGSFVYQEGSIYGCCDLIGNAREWCNDWYEYRYKKRKHKNPTGPTQGTYRICRGGGHNSIARDCLVAMRGKEKPGKTWDDLGFRLVVTNGQSQK